ncbi:hypothetical protein D3C87_687400 [compost metagenome]
MTASALEYIPTGEICDIEGGTCYGTFPTPADALAWMAVSIQPQYRGNYRIVPLPAHLKDSRDLPEFMPVADVAQRLIGPRGVMGDGTEVTSEFRRFNYDDVVGATFGRGWRWAAFDKSGAVMHVIDMPDVLPGFHNTRTGALWCLRDIADAQVCRVPVRCQREH